MLKYTLKQSSFWLLENDIVNVNKWHYQGYIFSLPQEVWHEGNSFHTAPRGTLYPSLCYLLPYCWSVKGHRKAGANYSWLCGKRQGTPWARHQSIAGLTQRDEYNHWIERPLTQTPTGHLEQSVDLIWLFWGCLRKPMQLVNSSQKGPSQPQGSNPGLSCFEATVLTTVSPMRFPISAKSCCNVFPTFQPLSALLRLALFGKTMGCKMWPGE